MKKYPRSEKYDEKWVSDNWMGPHPLWLLEELWDEQMFSLHSGAWWRHLWEKTGLVEITACYDIENVKEIWQPWAKWAREHMDFNDDDFLAADTNNDVAFIIMTAKKK